MDEFSLRKGHKYATVVVDPRTKRVLWVGRGRTREDIRPFFELLGEDGCRAIKAVGMDMSLAFEEEVRLRCTQAVVRFWNGWYARAMRSRIEPLKRFARRLKTRLHGIVAHCQWPLNTSLLEGINNRIKVMKRMAYGFRDHDYFFLKIRAAFPGIAG